MPWDPATHFADELASDSTASGLMATVSQGILDAQDGVGQIAIALLQGQKAPAASRDQVINGLTPARTALGQISTSDATATKDLGTLTRQVASASAAGAGVIANCV
ncbi:hypothetical protein NLI96_g3058 [Meripilus lineatus]|uniref:Uncharacterized protein n=1 Tax=Meripilus lineatus TaxID=2056292 RepID=A0AAD5YJE9_9APHY|nr:hypothetical protein NLI96_g3058 [Physisporinus lineatus]